MLFRVLCTVKILGTKAADVHAFKQEPCKLLGMVVNTQFYSVILFPAHIDINVCRTSYSTMPNHALHLVPP